MQIQAVDNSNISEKHLGKRLLHLNREGNTVFASNFIIANNIYNDFVCNDNLLNVNSNGKNFQQQIKGVTVDEVGKNIESDVTELSRLRNIYLKNSIIGYLNMNHFENKVINLREICHQAPIDIICVDETKLDSSYPDSQFHIDGYQFPPSRRDRNKYGGGKIVDVREGFIVKRLVNLEENTSETICTEVTISKKKWCIIFAYRPPHSNNKKVFLSELTTSLNQVTNKYDNIIVMGDLNIGIQKNGADTNHYLSDLYDTFSLANLISSSTCFKPLCGTSIYVLLTNKTRRSFHNTAKSDHHKLMTFFRSHFERIPPK